MFGLLALSSFLNLILNLVTNFRLIVTLAVLGTLAFFGYQLYHNGMDMALAWLDVKVFWLSMWDWAVRGWEWVVSVMPF